MANDSICKSAEDVVDAGETWLSQPSSEILRDLVDQKLLEEFGGKDRH